MPRLSLLRLALFLAVCGLGGRALAEEAPAVEAATGEGIEFFEKNIRPVLVRECYECHSTNSIKLKGGLLLDSRDGIRNGGDSGPAVVPGQVAESLLITALRHEGPEMPPEKRLPDEVIADFVSWIEMGAPDPRDGPPDPNVLARQVWEGLLADRRGWWCFQPMVETPVPAVQDTGWSEQPIDRFILSRLESQGLGPASRAEAAVLVRRLAFALTGLPPSPEDVQTLVRPSTLDPQPLAYHQLVDRLLASPHFGERWARHWMDVVRYTDTYGYEWDIPAKGAWRYRDYLTRAFNQDVPFDQLVREQLAGDLLPQPRIDAAEQINESLIGLMFYQMGEKRHGDSAEFNGIHQEMVDNKIEAFSKAFQGLTIACARCHDHKLDPISQREYYALAGVFMSSRWVTNTVDLPARNAVILAELKAIKAELRPRLAEQWREDVREMAAAMLAASEAAQEQEQEGRIGAWRNLFAARSGETPPALEDPLYVWMKAIKAARPPEGGTPAADVGAAWDAAAAEYQTQWTARPAENAGHFLPLADFRQGLPAGWSRDGTGLTEVAACGEFVVALEGDAAVARLLPGGWFTNTLSPKLNGALRTPHLGAFANHGQISFECCGGDFSAVRTVVDNAFLCEKQKYVDRKDPAWETLSTWNTSPERHVYLEFATKTSNPNFPPRVGLGGACSEEQAAQPQSWFGVTRAVLHNAPQTPADELARFKPLIGEGAEEVPPGTRDLRWVAERYAAWFEAAVAAWAAGQPTEDDVRLINWLLDAGLLTNTSDELVSRYREAESRLAPPCTVNGMADPDPGFDYQLNIRGDYDQLGDAVPRGYLEVLTGASTGFGEMGSGRLRLAELVASPTNPLTARVFVNRVWHWLFGTGLVATPDNFGLLGGQPSHPELLDWLAARFVAEGWSLKKLVREIVLTETWRQSGQTRPEALAADPENRLLHHYSLRRLEAEEIRDNVLAAAGRLDASLYGPPINPHRANEDPQKRLFSGPLDGDGRRSIYTKITIMEPPRLLALFNQPNPKIPTGRRDVTNTPAQSLALLNDAFVTGQAEEWARRLVARPDVSPSDRLDYMFRTALGRPASEAELTRWCAACDDLAALHQVSPEERMASPALWKDLAHAVFNLKEFIYIQ